MATLYFWSVLSVPGAVLRAGVQGKVLPHKANVLHGRGDLGAVLRAWFRPGLLG